MHMKKVEYGKEFLTQQMNHWMLFPMVLTALGIRRELTGRGSPEVLLWALCSAFPLIFFAFRCRVRRFYLFALLHMGVVGGAVLLSWSLPSLEGVLCVLCAAAYALYSIFLQMKKDALYTEPIQLPVGVTISVLSLLLQHYQGVDDWDAWYSFTLIGTIALFFIIFYLQRYLDFLAVNKSSAGYLPASEMLRSGLGLALGYTLLGAFLLAAVTHSDLFSGVVRYVKEAFLRLLRYLFSLLPESGPGDVMPLPEATEDLSMAGTLPREGPFWLWEVLWRIVETAALLALVFLAAKLLLRFLKWLRQYLVLRKPGGELQEEEAFDLRERCGIEKTQDKKKQKRFDIFSHRERIRRLYKKKLLAASMVMSERERGRLEYDTAREWEARLDAEGMAELYEQARYSRREVTGADVKRMKDACRP